MVKRRAESPLPITCKRTKLDASDAVLVIQRAWRWMRLRKAVRRYRAEGYTLWYFKWNTYATSKDALGDETVLRATSAVVEGLLRICPPGVLLPESDINLMKQGAYPLLFLVAYQVCVHTFEVFPMYDTEEMLFSESAWRFVWAFEAICRFVSWGARASAESIPLSMKQEFAAAVFAVARTYWKWSDQRRPLKERRYRQRLTKLYFERYEFSETKRLALDPAASHEWESQVLRQEASRLTYRILEFEMAFVSSCGMKALERFNRDLKLWVNLGAHNIRFNAPHMDNYGNQWRPELVTPDMLVHVALVRPDAPRFSLADFTHPYWERRRRLELDEAISKAVQGIQSHSTFSQQRPWPFLRLLWILSQGLGRVVGRDPDVPAAINWISLGQYVTRCQLNGQPLEWRRLLHTLQDVVKCMLTIANSGNNLESQDRELFQAAIYARREKRAGPLRAYLQFMCNAYLRVVFDRYNRVVATSKRRIAAEGVRFERARFAMRLSSGLVNLTRLKEIVTSIIRVLLVKEPSYRERLVAADSGMLHVIVKNVILFTVFREDAVSKARLPHTLLLDETMLGGVRVECLRIPGFVSLVASVRNALEGNPRPAAAKAVEDDITKWLNVNCRGASFVQRERFNNAVRVAMRKHYMSKVDAERAIIYNYSCFPMGKQLRHKALARGIEQALVESLLTETDPSIETMTREATEFFKAAAPGATLTARDSASDFPGLAVFHPRLCDSHRILVSVARINMQVHSDLYAAVVRGVIAETFPA